MRTVFTLIACVIGLTGYPCLGNEIWPLPDWTIATPEEAGLDSEWLERARDYALSGGGSGRITRHGNVVMTWGDQEKRYDLKSTTKSIGVTALGLALGDGKLLLDDLASDHHPSFATPPESNADTGWIDRITIRQLATHTAGFEKPGGYTPLIFEPGTKWLYSDGGPNWLAECLTLIYKQDVDTLLFARVFTLLGITRKDLAWRRNQYRDATISGFARREFGSGISADVDAMARIGYLYLRKGRWQDKQLVPAAFVEAAGKTASEIAGLEVTGDRDFGNASDHYGLLWWNNNDGTLAGVPRDAYWSWGLYDSLILVIPSLDIVVTRAGKSWERPADGDHYAVLRPFFEPIVAAVRNSDSAD